MSNVNAFPIEYSASYVKGFLTRKRLKSGGYLFRVTKAGTSINAKGNMSLTLEINPVDSEGNTKTPSLRQWLTLPFRTPPESLQAAGVPPDAQEGVPDTAGIILNYALARTNATTGATTLPAVQKLKKISGAWVAVDATGHPTGETMGSKEEREAAKAEQMDAAMRFILEAWAKPEVLLGDEFLGVVFYKEGKEYGDLKIVSTLPAGAELVDTTESITESVEA